MQAPEPAPRLGWLKNGNRPGRFSDAKRCGAGSKRSGEPCRAPACRGKRRCRFHGGKSTGPRTAEGLERSRRARRKHGAYSVETRQDLERQRAEIRVFLARGAALRERILGDMAALIRQLQRQRRNRRRRVRRRRRGASSRVADGRRLPRAGRCVARSRQSPRRVPPIGGRLRGAPALVTHTAWHRAALPGDPPIRLGTSSGARRAVLRMR